MRRIALFSLLFLALPLYLSAQATEGSILGTAFDQAGAALVAAHITVTNTQTNFARTTVTNGSGEYVVSNLPLGFYNVTAEVQGFQREEKPSIEMTVKARIRVDFYLKPGVVSQIAVVTNDEPLLKTDTPEVSTLITRDELAALPSLDRNFLSLQVLTPGTYRQWQGAGGDRIADFSGGESMQVDGVNTGQNNFILDGISNNLVLTGGMNSVPPMDAIQEVAIQTNGYSAEFGRAGGGIVNVALRSGTNQVHAFAYDYLQNDFFDARPYDFTGTNPAKQPLRRNLFGAGGGGPIKRNKAFFFFNYEGLRQPSNAIEYDAVPTQLERNGDFSQSGWTVYDPTTTDASGNRQAFQGNVIPPGRINALMSKLISEFPLPNYKDPNPTVLNNYLAIDKNIDTRNTYNAKSDINISSNDTLTLRYSYQQSEKDRSGFMPGSWIGGKGLLNGNNVGINETHVFSPNLVNEFRTGWNYIHDGNSPANTTLFDQLHSIPGSLVQAGYPAISLRNIASTKAIRPLTTLPNPYVVWQNSLQYMDNVSWHKGNHAFKFGFDFTDQRNMVGGGAPPGGLKFSVDGYATVASTTAKRPNNLTGTAEGLLGYVNTLTSYNYGDKTRLYQNAWSLFLMDDWRVSQRLSVSVGLRFEHTPDWITGGDLETNFDLNSGLILVPDDTKAYVANTVGLPNAILPPTYQYAPPSSVYAHADSLDVAPRVGFAYSLTPQLVLRANYGFFFAPPTAIGINNVTGAPFSYQVQIIGDQADPVDITQGFPTGGIYSTLASNGIAPVQYQNHYDQPVVDKFGLNLQYAPFSKTAFEFGYDGNHAHGLDEGWQLNFPTPGPGDINARRPYPALAEGTGTTFIGESFFNAFEATVRQQAIHGVAIQSSITVEHSYGQNGITNPYNYSYSYGRLTDDYGRQWVTSVIYDTPALQGQPLLEREVLGGWQTSGIVQLRGGLPFSIASSQIMNDDLNASRANVINTQGDAGTPVGPRGINNWFNANAFTTPDNYTYGDSGVNILRGPALSEVEFALQKTFAIGERYKLTYRAEAENLLNHVNLGNPSSTLGSSGFDTIRSLDGDPREMQMVLRFAF